MDQMMDANSNGAKTGHMAVWTSVDDGEPLRECLEWWWPVEGQKNIDDEDC